jgi:tRNA(His) 5'-end guanylyltransferase
MTDHTSLGDRMKAYEKCYNFSLPRRSHVVIRLDGKAFHTWTRGLKKPYDEDLWYVFCETVINLVSHMQNVQFAYFQSDEISIYMNDFNTIHTEPWFGNELQKLVSVSASICTAHFNSSASTLRAFENKPLAYFDSRAFLLPEQAEVFNYFYWRFRDCMRNSILSAGQFYFSQKQLHGKNTSEVQEMLFQEHGVNWSKDFPDWNRNGTVCFKVDGQIWQTMPCPNLLEDEGKGILSDWIPSHEPYKVLTHGNI